MAGKLNLWHHINMSLSRESYNLPNILLRIITSVSTFRALWHILPVLTIPPFQPIRLCAIGRLRRQLRILVYLQAPSARIRQVKMQLVQLIISHHIQQFHDLLLGEEMTRNIEVQTTITETRHIGNRDTRETFGRIKLLECLFSIEKTGICSRFHDNTLFANR